MDYMVRESNIERFGGKVKKKEKEIRTVTIFLGMICLYVLLQIKNINAEWFGTDELDIMVLGKGIAHGQLLYDEAASQHMPFSYYISALFYKLGAISVTEQRIAFYVFIALFWTLIVFLYSNIVDKRVLFLYPVVHCCMIQNYNLGTAILSEHLAGCGAIILLLEFLRFMKQRNLNITNCIMISVSIIMTFGTIFVAIYPVFFIAIGVVMLEFKWKKEHKYTFVEWLKVLLKRYTKLILIVMFPWVLLCGYYLYTHTFDNFILCAYKINRDVYPKYNGGLGSNIFTLFLAPIDILSGHFINGFNLSEWNYMVILQWIFIICAIIFLWKFFMENGSVLGIVLLMFVFSLGSRGIFNFHGTACVEVLSFFVTYVFVHYAYKSKENFKSLKFYKQACWIMIFLLILSGYCQNISKITTLKFEEEKSYSSTVIEKITDSEETIWMATFDNADAMLADRVVTGAEVTTPWTWEGIGKKRWKKFKENAPRVAIFSEGHECWGHKIADYAPKVVKYIKKNYTLIPDTCVYVRNDYYEEACEKIAE
ncbi:MAG: hypothetical protein NC124_12420 [Clostridium sp.]|nr:hypothetical protein [Clostridium sp.]